MSPIRHVFLGTHEYPFEQGKGEALFEAVESVEFRDRPGAIPVEKVLGRFADEGGARAAARAARRAFLADATQDYAWWTVRQEGARLARWIADSKADKEFVLDLRSGELVELAD